MDWLQNILNAWKNRSKNKPVEEKHKTLLEACKNGLEQQVHVFEYPVGERPDTITWTGETVSGTNPSAFNPIYLPDEIRKITRSKRVTRLLDGFANGYRTDHYTIALIGSITTSPRIRAYCQYIIDNETLYASELPVVRTARLVDNPRDIFADKQEEVE